MVQLFESRVVLSNCWAFNSHLQHNIPGIHKFCFIVTTFFSIILNNTCFHLAYTSMSQMSTSYLKCVPLCFSLSELTVIQFQHCKFLDWLEHCYTCIYVVINMFIEIHILGKKLTQGRKQQERKCQKRACKNHTSYRLRFFFFRFISCSQLIKILVWYTKYLL